MRRMRAVMARRASRFVPEGCVVDLLLWTALEVLALSWLLLSVRLVMLGSSSDSSWKCTRAAMSNLEKSLGPRLPSRIGVVNRRQRELHASCSAGRERAADFTRASCTAPQKRAQRSAVSAAVAFGRVAGVVFDRILTKSAFV